MSKEIVDLVVRIARESPTWGYDRIQGALANLGFNISATTVATILKAHGVDPAPDRRRRSSWKTFLEAHWDVLASVDFTTVEVWTRSGLITCSVGQIPGNLEHPSFVRILGESGRVNMARCQFHEEQQVANPVHCHSRNGAVECRSR